MINTSYSYGCSILSLKCHKIYTWGKEAFINLITFLPRELWAAVTSPVWRTWGIYWASQVTVTCSTARVFRCQSKVSILCVKCVIFQLSNYFCSESTWTCTSLQMNPSLKKVPPSPCLNQNSKLYSSTVHKTGKPFFITVFVDISLLILIIKKNICTWNNRLTWHWSHVLPVSSCLQGHWPVISLHTLELLTVPVKLQWHSKFM